MRFGILNTKPVFTLLTIKHGLSTSQSLSSEAELNKYSSFSRGIHYLSLVSSLLYTTQTHLDIQFFINLIAQFSENSGIPHLEAAKYILYYLKGTQDFSLVLECYERGAVNVISWTDLDWAGNVNTR